MKTYHLKDLEKKDLTNEERRAIERSILETYECPHCGETESPFLDYFGLDIEIHCTGCGQDAELRYFLDTD